MKKNKDIPAVTEIVTEAVTEIQDEKQETVKPKSYLETLLDNADEKNASVVKIIVQHSEPILITIDLTIANLLGELGRAAQRGDFYHLNNIYIKSNHIISVEVLRAKRLEIPKPEEKKQEKSLEELQREKQPFLQFTKGVMTHDNRS